MNDELDQLVQRTRIVECIDRLEGLFSRVLFRNDAASFSLGRITSYNVCYTKLLRISVRGAGPGS